MGMRPDSMERWGVVSIFKEAGRLLHKHFRLFLPFLLAFYLPTSLLSVFQAVFPVVASGPPLSYTGVVKRAAYTAVQGREMDTDGQSSLILSWTISLLIIVVGTLAVAAFAYIVAYIYSNVDSESDDDSITKKVFKLLPHAFFRIFVTQLWTFLLLFLLAIACVIFASILSAILSAIIGGSGPTPAIIVFMMVPDVVATIALTILFACAQYIAVLEPEKYGRAALKLSTKYAKGRASTIFSIVLISVITAVLTFVPAQALAKAGLPLWVKIIVAIFLSILNLVVSAYLGVVGVVMYFVCKSTFEALLPEFQRGSNIPSAENPYEPLVSGSTNPKTIGEP